MLLLVLLRSEIAISSRSPVSKQNESRSSRHEIFILRQTRKRLRAPCFDVKSDQALDMCTADDGMLMPTCGGLGAADCV